MDSSKDSIVEREVYVSPAGKNDAPDIASLKSLMPPLPVTVLGLLKKKN